MELKAAWSVLKRWADCHPPMTRIQRRAFVTGECRR